MPKVARYLTAVCICLAAHLAHAQIVASVLPTSRSVQVGKPATAFAAIVNSSTTTTVTGCTIAPDTSVAANFVYQTTNPATNAVTGTPNTPVNIPAGGLQTFVIAFTPTAAFAATDVALNFSCTNTDPAPQLPGINSLLLAASSTASADIVALAATMDISANNKNDGVISLPSATGAGAFAVATVNVGAADTITASADTGGVPLPVNIALCQTNQMTGACLGTPATTVSTAVAASATPTFGIFVTGTNNVAPLPGANRIFVRFKDHLGNSVGATGVAVQTQGYHPALPPALTFSVPDPLPNGTVNQDYGGSPDGVSLCSPRPANSTTAPCVPDPSNPFSPTAPGANPQGGSPPYHCQLDSGVGFPPIGISLTKDCFLKGKPTASGTATFKVCAVDLNGSQVCQTTHLTVTAPSQGQTFVLTYPSIGTQVTLAVTNSGAFTGTGTGMAAGCPNYPINYNGTMSGTAVNYTVQASYCSGQGTLAGNGSGTLNAPFPNGTSASGQETGTIKDPLGTRSYSLNWQAARQ